MSNLVLITSKIVTSNNPFNYVEKRSIYTVKERYNQTLDTIASIKKHIPNNYIILMDNSVLIEKWIKKLRMNVNLFINPTDNLELNNDTDNHSSKAVSELSQMIYAIEKIKEMNLIWKYFFKISGRYLLNNKFKFERYQNEDNNFKVHRILTNMYQSKNYWTVFYKINNIYFKDFSNQLKKLYIELKNNKKMQKLPYEMLICSLTYHVTEVAELGITINCSVERWIEDI